VVLRNFEGFITTYNEPNDYTGHTTARPERILPTHGAGEGISGLLAGAAAHIKPEGFDRTHQRNAAEAARLGEVTWEPLKIELVPAGQLVSANGRSNGHHNGH
jgi:lysine 2,3-aminomutase